MAKPRPQASSKSPRKDGGGVRPALVEAIDADPGRVRVRLVPSGTATARLALASSYRPSEGDRVLVAGDGEELYVIGVLHAAKLPVLPLPDGSSVAVEGEAVELRDPEGRLLLRYEGGAVEIAAPSGDLTLAAPEGRVVVRSGTDIALEAARDITQRAAHRAEVEAARLEVKAGESRVTTGQASVVAERISTTASVLVQTVERFELTAARLVEKTRDTYRDATGLVQTRAERMRSVVKDVYALYARRTTIASREETSIDGSKVLLG